SGDKVAAYEVTLTRFTVQEVADMFARRLDMPMVNQTGLAGEYNFKLELRPDESQPNPMDATILMRALREQLGLSLQSKKTPMEVMVIDVADKVVAGN